MKGMIMKKLLVFVAAAFAAYAPSVLVADQVAIGASGSGSGPYVNAGLMAETANKSQDKYKFSIQTTGGYKDNLGLVLTDKVDIALNTLIGIYDAYNQNGSYGTSPMKEDFKRLRYLFTFGAVPQNIFVRADSGITSLQEIKGKSFNINKPSSFTHGMNKKMLEAAEISIDSFKVGTVATGQVFEQVQNKVFVGGAHVYQLGLGKALKLSSTVDVNYLDVPQDVIDRMNVGYNGLLVPYTIPANTYVGQANDVNTFGLAQVIFTDDNADEDLIYKFTKSFWENIGELQSSNTSFAGMNAELGSKMYDVPMHPGATRYFKEIGLK
jgi:TRAP transporter TAXI family solute receptor|tara:strand:- start:120 stop:1091 length:972 start_codon:yes stop_codon:yes gene_type:complete